MAAEESFSGLIIRSTGKAQIERAGKVSKAKRNALVHAGDILITGKKSSMGLQLADGVHCQIGPGSRVDVKELFRRKNLRIVYLKIEKGEIISKADGKNEAIQFKIEAPTAVAAVRGTEFLVMTDGDEESTVGVNEGEVLVETAGGANEAVKAGEKIVTDAENHKRSILESFETEKFRILKTLDAMKQAQFDAYTEQIRRNEAVREHMQNQTLPDSENEDSGGL